MLVTEVLHFSQMSLMPRDVMMLDTEDQLFVWLGSGAEAEEQRLSIQIAHVLF